MYPPPPPTQIYTPYLCLGSCNSIILSSLLQHRQKHPSSSTESTHSRQKNQKLHTYLWQNITSSYATITPQSSRRGLQTQADQLGRDGPYLLPTQKQTRLREIHNKQCDNHYQMDGDSENRISILRIFVFYSRSTWTCWGRIPKRQVVWKSCGHSMPIPSG